MNPPQHVLNELVRLHRLGDFQKVKLKGAELVRQFPNSPVLLNLVGVALLNIGEFKVAAALFERALSVSPNSAMLHLNHGRVLLRLEHVDEAGKAIQKALRLDPKHANAHLELGNVLNALGKHNSALKHFRSAAALDPRSSRPPHNIGVILRERGDVYAAISYFRKSTKLDPGDADAAVALGSAYHQVRQLDLAVSAYQRALRLDKFNEAAHPNLAEAYLLQKRYDLAVQHFHAALDIDPGRQAAKTGLLAALSPMLAWDEIAAFLGGDHITSLVSEYMHPLDANYFTDDPSIQFELTTSYCAERFPPIAALPLSLQERLPDGRMKVGYISTNFQEHPVVDLTTGLFREYDRSRFEVHAIGYGPKVNPEVREVLEQAGVHVHDLKQIPDASFVSTVQSLGLDIAVDMTGYTGGSKTKLFAHGLAPIQVNYLAYPGTLGSEAFDYIVGDETVIGPDQTDHYVEQVMWLPDSFMPCDNQRVISETVKSRSEYGLPDEGFVFCSFNNPVKISPREFDIWMRLLDQVEGSCLWLTGKNKWVPMNLRQQAEKRGIDPDRLVFTERVAMDEHLARHAHADLFLDTFNYNAHTTANEALWSGLPLVTKIGDQFAARVAASLLRAVGLPELVTQSEAEYEALALALARDPARLAGLREKLQANRLAAPLFDTKAYVRHFEAGLIEAHRRQVAGEPVSNIKVSDL